ncbi:MAG: hypothetical protein U5K54_10475 [Cytophagales bacterium]|nr:hypothetical protein [Cytophagales bacterium]
MDQKAEGPWEEVGLGMFSTINYISDANHSFIATGAYQLSLKQFNRQDSLHGVIAVGIRVEEAQELNP